MLVRKALDAATSTGVEDLLIGGGVAANSRLRAMAEERAAAVGVRVQGAAARPVHRQRRDGRRPRGGDGGPRRTPSALDLPADSSQPVTTVLV